MNTTSPQPQIKPSFWRNIVKAIWAARQKQPIVTAQEAEAMVKAAQLLDSGEIGRIAQAFAKLNHMVVSGNARRQYWDIRLMVNVASVDVVGIDTASEMFGEMAQQRIRMALADRLARRTPAPQPESKAA